MWEQIRSNERRSVVLVIVAAMLLFALGYLLAEALVGPGAGLFGLGAAFIAWILLSLMAYYAGDQIFLGISGARQIEKEDMPRLWNVVEEMTIASGMPEMPAVYIIDDRAPNAFATGRTPDRAAVAVTSGLLKMCNRDELQGVVAHEMGHVNNRDVLLMLMAGALVGSIVLLAEVGMRAMWFGGRTRSRSSRMKGGGQVRAILLIVAIVLMILAPLIARLIYFALSRRREYLADASGALYTRYPDGLASALEKIGGSHDKVQAANRATAPMYIVNPLKQQGKAAVDLAATHPPLSHRVKVLRSMGGVSFAHFEQAYKKVHGERASAIPATSMHVGRGESKRERSVEEEDSKRRAREIQDFLWRVNNFLFLACACGTVLKRPPDLKKDEVECPNCGRMHKTSEFEQ